MFSQGLRNFLIEILQSDERHSMREGIEQANAIKGTDGGLLELLLEVRSSPKALIGAFP